MTAKLKKTSLADIAEVIQEVDETKAFVVSKDEPDFSAWAFLNEFEQQPDFHLFVLMHHSEAAGFISILPNPQVNALDIGPMYVRPQFRGQGLGSAQVQAVVDWAKANRTKHLTIRTWGKNARVRHIVHKLGFRLIREIPEARIDGDSTVYYALELDQQH